nr:MAG TPA: hypothetical protein [Caudoviricetes sp.]
MRWVVERQHGCVGWMQMVIVYHRQFKRRQKLSVKDMLQI